MKTIKSLLVKMGVVLTCALASCSKEGAKNTVAPDPAKSTMADMIKENGSNPDEAMLTTPVGSNTTTSSSGERNKNAHVHFLYSETNESGNNRIFVYEMGADGSLYGKGATASGGAGTGMGLGSQGELA